MHLCYTVEEPTVEPVYNGQVGTSVFVPYMEVQSVLFVHQQNVCYMEVSAIGSVR